MGRIRNNATQLSLFGDGGRAQEPEPSLYAASVSDRVEKLARDLPESLYLGTSSWTFPGWKGLVYEGSVTRQRLVREGLGPYASHPLLRAVGVDRTYYSPIDSASFANYASQVPEGFRFLVKAHQFCTSPKQIERREGAGGVSPRNPYFLDPVYALERVVGPMREGLGDKAGPLLFQFAPFPAGVVGGAQRFAERLHTFLSALPKGPLYAVELRTRELLTRGYAAALADCGVAHCYNVHPTMPSIVRQGLVAPLQQSPALVVRWMLGAGQGYEAAKSRYEPFDRLVDEDLSSRQEIARLCVETMRIGKPGFVIANNKAEGSSPLTVEKLSAQVVELIGQK